MTGRIMSEEKGELHVIASGFAPEKITKIKVSEVKSRKPSKISMMPPALINTMNKEELKDLMAYLVSAGNRKHRVFR